MEGNEWCPIEDLPGSGRAKKTGVHDKNGVIQEKRDRRCFVAKLPGEYNEIQ